MLSHPSIYMNRLKNYPFDVQVNDRIKKFRKRKPKSHKQTKRPDRYRVYFYFMKEKLTNTITEYFGDPEIQITFQTITPLTVALKDEMEKLSKEYDVRVVEDCEASNGTIEQLSVKGIKSFTGSPGRPISVENAANNAATSDHFNYDPLEQRMSLENSTNSCASLLTSSHSSNYHSSEEQMSVKDISNSSTSVPYSSDNLSYHPKQMSVEDSANNPTFCLSSSTSSYHPVGKQMSEDAVNSLSPTISSDSSKHNANSLSCDIDCRDEENSEPSFSEMLTRIKALDFGEESRILTMEERSMLGTILSEVIRYSEIYAQMDLVSLLGHLDRNKFNFRSFMTSVNKDFKCPASPPAKKKKRKKEVL